MRRAQAKGSHPLRHVLAHPGSDEHGVEIGYQFVRFWTLALGAPSGRGVEVFVSNTRGNRATLTFLRAH